jgi:hypothetical protein
MCIYIYTHIKGQSLGRDPYVVDLFQCLLSSYWAYIKVFTLRCISG